MNIFSALNMNREQNRPGYDREERERAKTLQLEHSKNPMDEQRRKNGEKS